MLNVSEREYCELIAILTMHFSLWNVISLPHLVSLVNQIVASLGSKRQSKTVWMILNYTHANTICIWSVWLIRGGTLHPFLSWEWFSVDLHHYYKTLGFGINCHLLRKPRRSIEFQILVFSCPSIFNYVLYLANAALKLGDEQLPKR